MMLMEEAERIALQEHGSHKISVISGMLSIGDVLKSQLKVKIINFFPGVGTRNYYRKIGYELDGPYMSKMLL